MTIKYACLLLVLLPLVAANGSSLEDVLGAVDTVQDVPRRYTETRVTPKLREPLLVSGEVVFRSDGSLVKTIDAPVNEVITISAQSVILSRNGKARELPFSRQSGVRELYQGIRAALEADVATLERLFYTELLMSGDSWELVCTPRSAGLQRELQQLSVTGSAGAVSGVLVKQSEDRWQKIEFLPDDDPL